MERVKKEFEDLRIIRLCKTKGESPKVLSSEDLNPEYLAFQEDLDFLDRKLAELKDVLKNAALIKLPPKTKRSLVDLGATVTVEVNGRTDEFEIVGSLEANPMLGRISIKSPVGSALLSHKVGDEVIISSPTETVYKIKKIKY